MVATPSQDLQSPSFSSGSGERLTIIVHSESEDKAATLVHAFIRLDSECEIQNVIRVRERGLHR